MNDHIAVVTDYNATDHLRERIAMALLIDAIGPYGTGKSLPEDIKMASTTLSLNAFRRKYSDYVLSISNILVGKFMSTIVTTGSSKGIKNSSVLVAELMQKGDKLTAIIRELQEVIEKDGNIVKKDPNQKRSRVWEDLVMQLWEDEKILTFIADTMAIESDMKESENSVSLRGYVDAQHNRIASTYIDDTYNRAYVGPETSKNAASFIQDPVYQKFCLAKVHSFKKNGGRTDSDWDLNNLIKVLTAVSSQPRDISDVDLMANFSSSMISSIEIISRLDGVEYAVSAKDYGSSHLKMQQVSDSKPLNMVLAEAQRIVDLYDYQLFTLLSIPFGLAQIMLQNIATPFIIGELKRLSPRIDAVYNVDAVVADFLSLPSSPTLATIAADLPTKGGLLYRNDTLPMMLNLTSSSEKNTDKWIQAAIGTMRTIIPLLYSLGQSTRLMSMYNRGGAKLGGKPVRTRDLILRNDNVGVTYTQWGRVRTTGATKSTLTDIQNGFLYDWGLNAVNGSALMLHMEESGISINDYVLPYHTGISVYKEYIDSSASSFSTMVTSNKKGTIEENTIMSGTDVSVLSMPIMVLHPRRRQHEFEAEIFDRRLIKYVSASMIPFHTNNYTYIVKNAKLNVGRKIVIGKYDIPTEREGLPIVQVLPFDKATAPPVKGSMLSSVLNVGEIWLDAKYVNESNVLKRFTSLYDTGKLASSGVSTHDFAIMAYGSLFVIPARHMRNVFTIIRIDPAVVINDMELLNPSLVTREIVGYNFEKGESRLAFKEAEGYMNAVTAPINAMIPTFKSTEDFYPTIELMRNIM